MQIVLISKLIRVPYLFDHVFSTEDVLSSVTP